MGAGAGEKIKRTAAKKKADRKKANASRRPNEHVLNTIDGSSSQVTIGELIPSHSESTGGRYLFKVVRVDVELDTVFGVIIERCPMPWWKWNSLWRKGLVDEEALEDFNRSTEG